MFPVVGLTPGFKRKIIFNDHLNFHELRLMNIKRDFLDIGSHTYDFIITEKMTSPL
ncbi:MAG: hypothetical protein PWP31_10 [Clostridia bacterium]|nr:hypothetical protein [Clostridia bacterium]